MYSKRESTPKISFKFSFSVIWQQWEATVGTIISCSLSCPKKEKLRKSYALYFVSKIFIGKALISSHLLCCIWWFLKVNKIFVQWTQKSWLKPFSNSDYAPLNFLRWTLARLPRGCKECRIMCTCYILLNKPHNQHSGKRKMYKKNCGCKLIKTCYFSSSQHEGMYFTAKEIYTRTTNLSSFYGTFCRFIKCSLPRIFFKNINSNE